MQNALSSRGILPNERICNIIQTGYMDKERFELGNWGYEILGDDVGGVEFLAEATWDKKDFSYTALSIGLSALCNGTDGLS